MSRVVDVSTDRLRRLAPATHWIRGTVHHPLYLYRPPSHFLCCSAPLGRLDRRLLSRGGARRNEPLNQLAGRKMEGRWRLRQAASAWVLLILLLSAHQQVAAVRHHGRSPAAGLLPPWLRRICTCMNRCMGPCLGEGQTTETCTKSCCYKCIGAAAGNNLQSASSPSYSFADKLGECRKRC
ncbi:hypothetical protein PVAP13_1NG348000 [Panicum virgatum]|uniref:Uncharacterized protein n=1 Tax=Panicum virgatum TaxID=38727 RepID=A0A8T0WY96_PANVG|nr:hypothetical protein PVAP13_1NG348000 [Panicum virgatum]